DPPSASEPFVKSPNPALDLWGIRAPCCQQRQFSLGFPFTLASIAANLSRCALAYSFFLSGDPSRWGKAASVTRRIASCPCAPPGTSLAQSPDHLRTSECREGSACSAQPPEIAVAPSADGRLREGIRVVSAIRDRLPHCRVDASLDAFLGWRPPM